MKGEWLCEQPLTTEPGVRAELCMSFSGESEGRRREEGLHFTSYGIQILPGT